MSTTERKTSIDLIKIIAIVGVIVIHVSARALFQPVGSSAWLGGLFWGTLARSSVPLFLMCSGALLLDPEKEMTLKKLYGHNLLRIVIAMLFWAMAYKLYHLLAWGLLTPAQIVQSAKEVLTFNQEVHLYYLHLTILVYAFLPVTRIITAKAQKRELEYLLVLWLLLGIIYPTLRNFWPFTLLTGIPVQWQMNMAYAAIGYGVLGYYLSTYKLRLPVAATLAVAGFLVTGGGTFWLSARDGEFNALFLEGMSIGVCMLGAGIFGICTGVKMHDGEAFRKIVTKLSRSSFCIFLVHYAIMEQIAALGLHALTFSSILAIPVTAVVIALVCIPVYEVLSRIPVVKKYLI